MGPSAPRGCAAQPTDISGMVSMRLMPPQPEEPEAFEEHDAGMDVPVGAQTEGGVTPGGGDNLQTRQEHDTAGGKQQSAAEEDPQQEFAGPANEVAACAPGPGALVASDDPSMMNRDQTPARARQGLVDRALEATPRGSGGPMPAATCPTQCAGGGHSQAQGAPPPGVVDTSPEIGPSPHTYGYVLELEPEPAAPSTLCTPAGPHQPHVADRMAGPPL